MKMCLIYFNLELISLRIVKLRIVKKKFPYKTFSEAYEFTGYKTRPALRESLPL